MDYERQIYKMISEGFSGVINSFRNFSKKLGKDAPEHPIVVQGGPTTNHQMFQLIKSGFNSLAKTIDDIEIPAPKPLDYTLPDSKKNEIIQEIIPFIPKAEDGKNYVLTEEDKLKIAQSITVPTVEKIIEKTVEKTEVVREKPVVTEVIKYVENRETPEGLIAKLLSVKRAWLDVDAISGDLSSKIPPRHNYGGANNALVDVYSDDTFLGGVREIQFESSGLSTELVNQGTRLLVTANGGGAGGEGYIEISGARDDSNTTFTCSIRPSYVIMNGMWYRPTGGAITWSWSAGTLTTSEPVGSLPTNTIFGLAPVGITEIKSASFWIESPDSSDAIPFVRIPYDMTISKIYAQTGSGTITYNIQERASRNSAGTNVLTSSMTALSASEVSSTSFSNAGIAEGAYLAFVTSASTGTPTDITITIEYIINS